MKKRTLTRSEMQLMEILWDMPDGGCVNDILEKCEEPLPAYTTVATFMKILLQKEFVTAEKRSGRTIYYHYTISREEYRRQVMEEVKDSFFGGSLKSLLSFFVKEEDLADEEVMDMLSEIRKK